MDQILRDPIWQMIGVVVAIVALGVAVVSIRKQQQRKSLGYSFSRDLPVFFVYNEAFKDRVKVTLDGASVENLRTLDITLSNNGNVPILPADYSALLKISFDEGGVKILGAGVLKSSPPDLGVAVEPGDRSVNIAPVLLNPRDEFTIQMLLEGSGENHLYMRPKLSGRIAGVNNIQHVVAKSSSRYKYRYYPFSAWAAFGFFILGIITVYGFLILYVWFKRS